MIKFSIKIISAILSFVISVSGIAALAAESADAGLPVAFEEYTAIADTYISESSPKTSYGLKTRLCASNADGNCKKIYMGFQIRDEIGEADQVLLKMTPISVTRSGSTASENAGDGEPCIDIFQASAQRWLQTELIWENAYKPDSKLGQTKVSENEEISFDVTAYVKASKSEKGYINFIAEAGSNTTEVVFPSVESLDLRAPKLVVMKDAVKSENGDGEKKNEQSKLEYKKINTKYPYVPEIPAMPEDFDIDEYTTTRYKPWMVLYHLTSAKQIKNRYYGGDAGQMGWAMAISPHNPDIMLIGSDTEAVWRSENGGVSWRASNKGLTMIGVTGLAFDPYDENIVYVIANSGNNKDTPHCGIYKSSDKGKSWRFITHIPNVRQKTAKNFAFGPKDSKGGYRVYYISNARYGLFASDDKGETWKNIGGLEGTSTRELITNGNDLLLTSNSDNKGLLISHDKGESWEDYNGEGLPKTEEGLPANALSVSINPVNSNHWLLTLDDNCLYTSTDAGKTWEFTCDNSQFSRVTPQTVQFGAPDENGDCIVYVTVATIQRNLRYSLDYGKTFMVPQHYNTDAYLVDNWGWGWEPMAVHPTDPYTVYIILDGEPYVTHDGGKTLHPSSSGYSGFRAMSMKFDPNNAENIMFTFTDRGFSFSQPTGRGEKYYIMDTFPSEDRFWIRQNGSKETGGIDFNYSDPNEVWISIGNGSIMKSMDGGRTFEVKKTGVRYTNIFINQQNPDIIYCSNWISYDHGETWNDVKYAVRGMSPVDNNVIYAREERNTYKSTDAGRTWEQLTSSPIMYTQRVTCSWDDPNKVYIGTNRGIYIVDGDNYRFIDPSQVGGKECYQVAQDPKNPNHLITAGNNQTTYEVSGGIYESFDDGYTWEHVDGFEGTADCWSIYWHPLENRVFFGTSNGTWVYELDNYYDMSKNIYRDVTDGYYAKQKIESLFNDGILYRYHDGYFRPDEGMRRERFADMVRKALDLKHTQYSQAFTDIDRFDVNYVNVQALYENGLIEADGSGEFRPKDNITYDEAVKILCAAVKMKHIPMTGDVSEMKNYVDGSIDANIRYAVYQLKKLGIIDDTVSFKSGKYASNVDIAVMFYNFMKLIS